MIFQQTVRSRALAKSPLSCFMVTKRGMAKAKEIPVALPPRCPQIFSQTVVLTNGATIQMRTTSPKGVLVLTKDTHNNPLWNPSIMGESDLSIDQMSKFTKKFAGLDIFGLEDEEDGVNVFETMAGSSALEVTAKDLNFLSNKNKKAGKK